MKILKKIGIVLLIALVIAQFFGPDKNDGDMDTVNTFIALFYLMDIHSI